MRHTTVTAEHVGNRLDQLLAKDKPEFTRSFSQGLVGRFGEPKVGDPIDRT
jgi:hypothetical protein